jgi:TIR domain
MKWDVFVSHASEDKDAVAEPLVHALVDAGLRVWYDRIELCVGDSLRKRAFSDSPSRAARLVNGPWSPSLLS